MNMNEAVTAAEMLAQQKRRIIEMQTALRGLVDAVKAGEAVSGAAAMGAAEDALQCLAITEEPSKDDLRQMVAAIAVGIDADDRAMAGLMQAARLGWEYGSGKRVRRPGVRLVGN